MASTTTWKVSIVTLKGEEDEEEEEREVEEDVEGDVEDAVTPL